ncbi:MAG: hypothetical protein ACOH1I_05200 [Gallionellaceae bacterium]|jgi:hypothetical protein
MRGFLWLMALLACTPAYAAPWVFDTALNVSATSAKEVFTHLEAAGRKSIAISAGWVAVAWEDNRDGTPRCYVALKGPQQAAFGKAMRVSGNNEAAEPAIVGLGQGRFALAWEEDGHIAARTLTEKKMGTPVALGETSATQVSLGFEANTGLLAVWSEQVGSYQLIRLAHLKMGKKGELESDKSVSIDSSAQGNQAYPSIAIVSAKEIVVSWEDRSKGNTRIIYATSTNGGGKFAASLELNEYKWRGTGFAYGNNTGTGAMRVALANLGQDGAVAVWADKRDFQSGYDIYADVMRGPKMTFGANEKVQDDFGNNIAQWHPAVAANARGLIAAVWDDDRDGTPDVWLSWRNANGWADNLALPGASGPGVQSDPSIAMDEAGNLYVAWVEKADLNAPSSIRYVMGHAQ